MSYKLCGYLWCYCLYSFMIEINGDKKKKTPFGRQLLYCDGAFLRK